MKAKSYFVLKIIIALFSFINLFTTLQKFYYGLTETWFNIGISIATALFAAALFLPNKRLSRWLSFVLAMLFTFKFANDLGLSVFCEKNDFAVPSPADLAIIYSLDIACVISYTMYFLCNNLPRFVMRITSFLSILVVLANLGWNYVNFSKNGYYILNDSIYRTMTIFYFSGELAILFIFILFLMLKCGKISLDKNKC